MNGWKGCHKKILLTIVKVIKDTKERTAIERKRRDEPNTVEIDRDRQGKGKFQRAADGHNSFTHMALAESRSLPRLRGMPATTEDDAFSIPAYLSFSCALCGLT
jgi:hypothetical protein